MPQPEGPVVVSAHDGRRLVVAGANAVAQTAGVDLRMALTQAQALVPGLTIIEHDPRGDGAALSAIALACLRYAPLVAVDPPDGIWIDVTGCTALAGGEKVLLAGLLEWLDRSGFTARAAIAETPAAAHAVARFGRANGTVVPDGEATAALRRRSAWATTFAASLEADAAGGDRARTDGELWPHQVGNPGKLI